jgi:hypothetical protein
MKYPMRKTIRNTSSFGMKLATAPRAFVSGSSQSTALGTTRPVFRNGIVLSPFEIFLVTSGTPL